MSLVGRPRAWAVLGLLACRHPAPPAPPPGGALDEPPAPADEAPAGQVEAGRYVDSALPLTVDVPVGWTARAGSASALLRVALVESATGVRVELLAEPGGTVAPVPRPGCTWTFTDAADHRYADLPGPLTIGTCAPDEPGEDRVQTWAFVRGGVTWHVDVVSPPSTLGYAAQHAEAVVRGARFGPE